MIKKVIDKRIEISFLLVLLSNLRFGIYNMVYVIIAVNIVMMIMAGKGRLKESTVKQSFPFMLWLFYMGVVSVFGIVIGTVSTEDFIKEYIVYWLLYVFGVYCFCDIDSDYVGFLEMIKRLSVVVSILAIYEYVTQNSFFLNSMVSTNMIFVYRRATVFFVHPIICGLFLGIGLLTIFYFPFKHIVVQVGSVGLVSLGIICTGSRSAMLPLVVLGLVKLFVFSNRIYKIRITKKTVLVVFASLVLVVSVFIKFKSGILEIVNQIGIRFGGTSLANETVRLSTFTNYISYMRQEGLIRVLFGSGVGFRKAYVQQNLVGASFLTLDNQYISLLIEYGWIGFASFIYCIYKCLKKARMAEKSSEYIIMSLLFICMNFLFYNAFSWPVAIFLFVFFAACALKGNQSLQLS